MYKRPCSPMNVSQTRSHTLKYCFRFVRTFLSSFNFAKILLDICVLYLHTWLMMSESASVYFIYFSEFEYVFWENTSNFIVYGRQSRVKSLMFARAKSSHFNSSTLTNQNKFYSNSSFVKWTFCEKYNKNMNKNMNKKNEILSSRRIVSFGACELIPYVLSRSVIDQFLILFKNKLINFVEV